MRVLYAHPFGQQALQESLHHLYRLDPVVDEEGLPAAVDLAEHRIPDTLVVERKDLRVDRQAVPRRRVYHRYVPYARHRHRERSRNRRRRHTEDIDAPFELLEVFLLPYAEAVFLVDDHEPQILEAHVPREEPVGPHDYIDLPRRHLPDDLLLFRGRDEPAQHLDVDRVPAQPLLHRSVVLHGEDGRRHEDRDLFP